MQFVGDVFAGEAANVVAAGSACLKRRKGVANLERAERRAGGRKRHVNGDWLKRALFCFKQRH